MTSSQFNGIEDEARPYTLTEGDLGDFALHVQQRLHELTVMLRDLVASTPGRPGPDGDQSEHRHSINMLGSSKGTLRTAIREGRHLEPEVTAKVLALAPISLEAKEAFLIEYTTHYLYGHAARCLAMLSKAFIGCYSNEPEFELGVSLLIRSRFHQHASRSEEVVHLAVDMAEAQRLMAASPDEFGWITDIGPYFEITTPSRPMAKLLDIEYEELQGAHLLAAPFRSCLEKTLGNFGEWVLIIGMLAKSAMDLQSQLKYPISYRTDDVDEFYEWLRYYASKHYEDVRRELLRVPQRLADGGSTRDDLRQCLEAALGRCEWPPYNSNRWNTIRMHIVSHPLLSPGAVARFEKKARPIPDPRRAVGYEVLWRPSRADPVANRLMFDILHPKSADGNPVG